MIDSRAVYANWVGVIRRIRVPICTGQFRRRMGAGMIIKEDRPMELSEWTLESLLGQRVLLGAVQRVRGVGGF